jgi:hypothetical protein
VASAVETAACLVRRDTVALSSTPLGRSRVRSWAVDRRGCRSETPIPCSTRPAARVSVLQVPGSGFRVPPEVILIVVRWYLRYGLSYRDLEELLAERGIEVDHVTPFRWVQRFSPCSSKWPGRFGPGEQVPPPRTDCLQVVRPFPRS